MGELIDLTIGRYEVGTIINENKNTEIVGYELEPMLLWFKKIREQYINDKNHVIVFLFDYDKNTNIEYYDNRSDIL